MIAALFVERHGVYSGAPSVFDLWDAGRDARLYAGEHPVIAHPPCERWGRYATRHGAAKGADGGCFESALQSVERWGGVIEHPAGSGAWTAFGVAFPPRHGGWVATRAGWTCCVEQGHYGHRARKPTWLYAVARAMPRDLVWGVSAAAGAVERLSHKQRRATPLAFRDALAGIVGGA